MVCVRKVKMFGKFIEVPRCKNKDCQGEINLHNNPILRQSVQNCINFLNRSASRTFTKSRKVRGKNIKMTIFNTWKVATSAIVRDRTVAQITWELVFIPGRYKTKISFNCLINHIKRKRQAGFERRRRVSIW